MSEQTCGTSNRCSSVVECLRAHATSASGRVAYTFLADGEVERGVVTFGDLDRQARSLAATLQSMGLAGERGLLLYPPGLDYVTALFGCLYAGVVVVPAYPPRRNRSLERLRSIIADAGVAAVFTTPPLRPAVEDLATRVPGSCGIPLVLGNEAGTSPETWREPDLSEDTLALLQYTSGSTGAPKGVMLTHGNLLHNSRSIRSRFGNSADSRGVIWLPPYHDMGLIGGILQSAYLGAQCYLMSPVSVFGSPLAWLQAVSKYRATSSGGPDFAYDLCVRKITPEQRATLDLSSWEVAFSGAEPVRAETIERFTDAFAPCGFREGAFYPCYGLAEATLLAAGGKVGSPVRKLTVRKAGLEANRVCRSLAGGEKGVTVVGCGRSLDDQSLEVVHPERLTRSSPGDVGEVWISGPSVAKGYWGRPDETRQTFWARLADTGEGPYLRTGDLGFLHDGELYITGRLKDLIILRGRNHYPQDLERTAERSHPDLQAGGAAAFSVEDDGQERLVVVAEALPRRQPDIDTVAGTVRQTRGSGWPTG